MTIVQRMQLILIFLELSSFITGLIYWKKVKNTVWQWFVVYLGFIVCGELICYYLTYFTTHQAIVNKILNYIVIPAEFLFLYWLYYKHAQTKGSKRLIIACFIIYIAGYTADQCLFQGKKFIFDSVSYCLGNLLLLLAIVSFFIQFSKGDEILQYKSSMIFWVSLGVLIFYLGTFPFFGLIHLLYDKYRPVFRYYTYFMFVFNWAMYFLFIVGFVKWKPR